MKKSILLLFVLFSLTAAAQSVWTDTLRTTVSTKHFKLPKKIVIIKTGKAVMYFSQKDYLKNETEEDTVRVEQKWVKEEVVAALLKKGRVKITNRFSPEYIEKFNHHLIQYGSICDRVFEFEDGVSFFRVLEITGIYDAVNYKEADSAELAVRKAIVQKREFNAPEEFPNLMDQDPIRIKDYFKPDISKQYVYKAKFNESLYRDTVACMYGRVGDQTVFYFPEAGYDPYNRPDLTNIETTMFGPGVYFYKNDSLFSIDAFYESDISLKERKDAALLFPPQMRTGDSTVFIADGDNRRVYTYLCKQDVTIDGKTYKDCVKFKELSYWPETIYIAYFWLEKDLGMVKWFRGTGRVDELVTGY